MFVHQLTPGRRGFLRGNDGGWISTVSSRRLTCPAMVNWSICWRKTGKGTHFRPRRCIPSVIHVLAWETFYHQCKPERHAESRRNMLSPWWPQGSKSSNCVRSGLPPLLTGVCGWYRFMSFSSIYECHFCWQETLARTFARVVTTVCLCVAAWWICDQCGWAV